MDKEKHIGGSKLLEQEIRKYKLLIKEGSLGRKHFDPDFIRKWDAVADNAVFINELQQIINQYQQAIVDGIAFYGDKNTIKPEGTVVNLSVRLFNLPQTGWTNWRFYKNGEFVRNYTIPQGEFNTHNGVYTFLTETVNEDTLYKIEVYQLNGEPYTYTGVWQVSTTNWKANTDEVWDSYFDMTQAEINQTLLGNALSVNLTMSGVGTRVEKGTVSTAVLTATASSSNALVKVYRDNVNNLLGSGTGSVTCSDTNHTYNSNTTYFATVKLGNTSKYSNNVMVTVYTPTPVVTWKYYWGLVAESIYDADDLSTVMDWIPEEVEKTGTSITNEAIYVNNENHDEGQYMVLAFPSNIYVKFWMNLFEWNDLAFRGTVEYKGSSYKVYATSSPMKASVTNFTLYVNKT